ncbi:MAG: hypothetical protein M1827_007274 [Pycnora praestabilis]|nr:MAG: hypothetical protein M1827_007274 [Pycnora praestabilis]
MAARLVQSCGVWFWIALFFFGFVIFQRSGSVIPGPYKLPSMTGGKGPMNINERMARSERAWEDSVERRHAMRASHPTPDKIPLFPAQELSDFNKSPYTIWDFFPAVWTCPWDIQRVGRLGDGGKWVCGMTKYEERSTTGKPPVIIYSFGVNGESTFEEEMLTRIPNAEIFAFDYSVDDFGPQLLPGNRERAHFMKVGLGATDDPSRSPPFYTLQSLMRHNKHEYMDILKIDIEGSEYVAFNAFMDNLTTQNINSLPIGQVMIEIHLNDDTNVNTKSFMTWWERLETFGMRPVWLEVNLIAVTLGKNKDQTNPRCTEYVWVNAKDSRSILLDE